MATHGMPSMVQLPKKISPKEAPTMALMPHYLSDSGACSREDPQPKLIPATSTEAPSYTFWLKGCSGSCLRASSKAWSPSPSLVTVLRNRAGMIRSVSMSLPGTGIARPATCRRALSVIALSPARRLEHLPHVGDRAVERGRRGHGGAHEQSPPGGAALAPDEVTVAGGRAHLAAPELVVVHAEAHRAAGLAPLEARGQEDLVQPFRLRGLGHLLRAGDDERTHALGHLALLGHFRSDAQIGQAPVGARAHEGHVDLGALDGLARGEAHVRERLAECRPLGLGLGFRLRDRLTHAHRHARIDAPG